MRRNPVNELRNIVATAFSILAIAGCGGETVDQACAEYFAQTPSSLKEMGPGVLQDSESGLVWFRCNLGQTYENGECIGNPINKDFESTMAELDLLGEETSFASNPQRRRSAQGSRRVSFSDVNWRMPTESDYDSITDVPCHSPKVDVTMFLDIRDDTYYWSSTAGRNDTYGCATRLNDGLRTCQTKKTSRNPTLLVADSENLLVADLE